MMICAIQFLNKQLDLGVGINLVYFGLKHLEMTIFEVLFSFI